MRSLLVAIMLMLALLFTFNVYAGWWLEAAVCAMLWVGALYALRTEGTASIR